MVDPGFDSFTVVITEYFHQLFTHMHHHTYHSSVVAFQDDYIVTYLEFLTDARTFYFNFIVKSLHVDRFQFDARSIWDTGLHNALQSF